MPLKHSFFIVKAKSVFIRLKPLSPHSEDYELCFSGVNGLSLRSKPDGNLFLFTIDIISKIIKLFTLPKTGSVVCKKDRKQGSSIVKIIYIAEKKDWAEDTSLDN